MPRLEVLRRLCLLGGVVAALAIAGPPGAGHSPVSAQSVPPPQQRVPHGTAFAATVNYVVQFYPRWFTFQQSNHATVNRLVGPARMTPVYHEVVAPNDDTLYVSSFVNLTDQPMVLTIPATPVIYSLLTLDVYGDVFATGIEAAGIYALTGPGWTGTLPAGVTPIAVPFAFSQFIFRADKFSPTGQNQTAEAEQFRSSLHFATLSEYLSDPSAGPAAIVPVELFSTPFKKLADGLIATDAIEFLKQLQTGVEAPTTPPLSPSQQRLADRFNSLFGDGTFHDPRTRSEFIGGAQRAHALIVDRYLTHRGRTYWITFTNIGAWGHRVLERSAITEFIQYGNGYSEAAYFQTFTDSRGHPLDASVVSGYVLTFSKRELPEAKRFWSLTAYIPESITLVENAADKYVVASYTPGLVTNPDGSVSVYMFPELPPGVPEANWLPVPRGPFNVMLRVYGPEGRVAKGTYVPPAIKAAR